MAYGALKKEVTLNDHAAPIHTRRQPSCHVCGSAGEVLYEGLKDRLFGVPGEWTLRRCLDENCGLLWLDPMPVNDALPGFYKSYYTHSEPAEPNQAARLRETMKRMYWNSTYGPAGARSAILPALLRLAPGFRAQLALQVFDLEAVEGGRLLDIGCGSGAALERLAKLGWQCEGVDFDENAVESARSRGLNVRAGSLEEQKYPAETFDAVVMNHVLEHVSGPRALLSECHRILKPGGQFVCITPNAASWGHVMFGRDWRGLEPPRHLHIFTLMSVARLMQGMGWSKLAVRSSIANSHGIGWASWQLKHSGKLDMRSRPGLWDGILARTFQVAASVRLLSDSDSGEELVVHGVKAPFSEDDWARKKAATSDEDC